LFKQKKDEQFSVKKCIDEVVEIAHHDMKKKNIELTITHSDDLPV
jgi:hypothetical protein